MMSVKPIVMPISPNDARSAIRVQKQLEADILRLREDIKRRSCNIPAAQHAIAMKERQMTKIQSYLRQYHVDLTQFDRREAERQRQAMRRQHAIFEDQRRAGVPGKHSAISKRARLDRSVEEIKAPSLPAPIKVPTMNPAEAAKRRRMKEEATARARQEVARKEAELARRAAELRRGQQARIEEMNRLKERGEQRRVEARRISSETKNVLANEAARRQKAAEEKRDTAMKAAHEKKMAEENARRAAEAKAAEQARIAKEKAEQVARQKAVREQQAAKAAQEKRAYNEMLKSRNDAERKYRAGKEEVRNLEKILSQITMEMQAAKVGNPEVLDDLREHRMQITENLTRLKRTIAPLEAEIQRTESKMQRNFSADNTAGLRAWHRDVLSTGHGRRQLSQSQRRMIQRACASLPADKKGRVKDLVARWEQGSDVDLGSEIQTIVAAHTANTAQALGAVAAIQGTPRHVKHGMSAVAQNNYHRLRQIQQAEDTIKGTALATEKAAIAQGESLSGLFPKLRSSVTRMVGN